MYVLGTAHPAPASAESSWVWLLLLLGLPFEQGRHESFFPAVSPVTKLGVRLGLE